MAVPFRSEDAPQRRGGRRGKQMRPLPRRYRANERWCEIDVLRRAIASMSTASLSESKYNDSTLLRTIRTDMDKPGERRAAWFRRYSLKTTFVLLTILCVLLGWVFGEVHHQHNQDKVIQRLAASGYAFEFERFESKNAFSAANWLDFYDERYLLEVVSARKVNPQFEELKELAQFEHLMYLNVTGPFATDQSLAWLGSATKLKELKLMNSRITDAGIQHVSGLKNLTSIDIRDTAVTDLGPLTQLPLKSLLVGDQITDAGMEKISRLKSLTFLSLSGPAISDNGLKLLANLSNLQQCHLTVPQVRGPGFASVALLSDLESLALSEIEITPEIAGNLARAPALMHLKLFRGQIGRVAIERLATTAKLKSISFYTTQVDSSGLSALAATSTLKAISFYGDCPNVKQDDAKQLRVARPDLHIWFFGPDGRLDYSR